MRQLWTNSATRQYVDISTTNWKTSKSCGLVTNGTDNRDPEWPWRSLKLSENFRNLVPPKIQHTYYVHKPPGTQASIFGACPKPGTASGIIMVEMAEMGAPISLDGVAVYPDCWCVCLCYLHFAREDGEMYLLVQTHPGCPGQSPESCKWSCVCVCYVYMHMNGRVGLWFLRSVASKLS